MNLCYVLQLTNNSSRLSKLGKISNNFQRLYFCMLKYSANTKLNKLIVKYGRKIV